MTLGSFLVCDDIRNEVGGKVSLMGVYGDTINFEPLLEGPVPPWPRVMKLGIFARLHFDEKDRKNPPRHFKVRLERNSVSEDLGGGNIDLTAIEDVTVFNMALVHPAFEFSGVGTFTMVFEFFGAKDSLLYTLASHAVRVTERKSSVPPLGSIPSA